MRALQLLLPALLPSWGFFDYIQPSPRIQYQLLDVQQQPLSAWLEFRPRPQHLSVLQLLQRLFWNPHWNETLFLMSCAERIAEHPNVHSEEQILSRLTTDWQRGDLANVTSARHIHFRLVFVQRQATNLIEDIRFVSRSAALIHHA